MRSRLGKFLRVFLLMVGGLLAVLFLLVVLSPRLISPLLGIYAEKAGLSWETAEPQGYASLTFREIRYEGEGIAWKLDFLRIPQPLSLLRMRFMEGVEAEVEGGLMSLRIGEMAKGANAGKTGFVPEDLRGIHRMGGNWLPWIPDIRIAGLDLDAGEGRTLSGRDLEFVNGTLRAGFSGELIPGRGSLRLNWLESGFGLEGSLVEDREHLELEALLELARDGPMSLAATLLSGGEPLLLEADLSGEKILPESLFLSARQWPLPGFLRRTSLMGATTPRLTLDLRAQGETYSLEGNLSARAPDFGDGLAEFKAKGDREGVTLSSLKVETEWMKATLSEPLHFTFAGLVFSGQASLAIDIDLDAQDWLDAQGRLGARLDLQPQLDAAPEGSFSVWGDTLRYRDFELARVNLEGNLAYPLIHLSRGDFEWEPGNAIAMEGTFGLPERDLDLQGSYRISDEFLQAMGVPVGGESILRGTLRLKGPFDSFAHEGTFEPLLLKVDELHPLELSCTWEGRIPDRLGFTLGSRSSTGAELRLSGSLEGDPLSGQSLQLGLRELEVSPVGWESFSLKESVDLELNLGEGFPLGGSSRIVLEGAEGGLLAASYVGADGSGALALSGLHSGMLGDWLTAEVPDFRLEALDLDFSRLAPFMWATFAMRVSGRESFHDELSFSLAGAFQEDGLRLEAVEGLIGPTTVLSGSLQLPLALKAREGGPFRVDWLEEGLLGGTLRMHLRPELLAEMEGIPYLERIGDGLVNLNIGGSPLAPKGELEASLTRLDLLSLFDETLEERPFRELEVNARLEPGLLTVRSLQASLGKARLDLSGDVGTEKLIARLKGELVPLREILEEVRGDLLLKALRAEQIGPLLPNFLRPRGFVDGELQLGRGLELAGQLRLAGFSMRPTLYSQTIDDIHLFLNLDGSRATLAEAGARIGESPVGVDGFLDFRDPKRPFYRLALSGSRIPLIRTASMLLQGDLDLLLERAEGESETLLSGDVSVVESVLLLDIDPLAPRTAGGAVPRPPFFRVKEKPFSDWLVDVSFSGRDSLRLRSQYAEALLSLDFQLEGQLSLPLLVGGLETGRGSIFFPATRLSLSTGEIFVTRSRQDAVQLELAATGAVASHVVTMAVKGTIEEPLVRFASTPDLSNAEIFRLLATGSLKSEGYGSVGLFLGRGLFSPGGGGDRGLLDRLTVEIGRDITKSGENSIDLFFELRDDLRLHGQYDKYDAQNLDLEWEVFSK